MKKRVERPAGRVFDVFGGARAAGAVGKAHDALGAGLPAAGGRADRCARVAVVSGSARALPRTGLFYAVGAALLPLFRVGRHPSGRLCDTCDALCSYGDREKRLAILKDPHVGAFGPMWLIAFLLAEVGCFAQIYARPALLPLAVCGFCDRARNGRLQGGSDTVRERQRPCASVRGEQRQKVVAAALIVEVLLYLTVAGLLVYAVPHGLTAATVLIAVLLVWHGVHEHMTRRIFGGITGDLAGFYISISELLALACAALGGLML